MWGYWLFIAMESGIMHLFLPADALAMNEATYVWLILVNSLILCAVLIIRNARSKEISLLLVGGFLLRLLLMFWSEYFSHIFTLPNSGADELTYYYNAMSNLVKGKEFTGYAQFFAWQANVFGLSKIYGKFINVLFSVSAILILQRILNVLEIERETSFRTIALACFLPNFAILSSLLLRESAIILLVAISVYCFICWWKYSNKWAILLSLCAAILAAWLHSGMVAYVIGILCVAVCVRRSPEGRRFSLVGIRTWILTVITAMIVLAVLLNVDLGLTDYFRGADSLEDIVSISDAYEDGGSAYDANIVDNNTTVGFLINTPFRMLYFMFAPMPWVWRSGTDAIAFLFSGLFYGYVFFKTLSAALKNSRQPLLSAMALIALLLLVIFGWGVSNSGTALRHRDKMVIHYLVMFALVGNAKRGKRALTEGRE